MGVRSTAQDICKKWGRIAVFRQIFPMHQCLFKVCGVSGYATCCLELNNACRIELIFQLESTASRDGLGRTMDVGVATNVSARRNVMTEGILAVIPHLAT